MRLCAHCGSQYEPVRLYERCQCGCGKRVADYCIRPQAKYATVACQKRAKQRRRVARLRAEGCP